MSKENKNNPHLRIDHIREDLGTGASQEQKKPQEGEEGMVFEVTQKDIDEGRLSLAGEEQPQPSENLETLRDQYKEKLSNLSNAKSNIEINTLAVEALLVANKIYVLETNEVEKEKIKKDIEVLEFRIRQALLS